MPRHSTIRLARVSRLAVLLLAGLLLSRPALLYAETSSPPATSFTGTLEGVPADTYDIYVRLAQPGQTAQVTVLARNGLQESLSPIGSLDADDHWARAGEFSAIRANDTLSFELTSDQMSNAIDANRPTLMLVSHTLPVCVPRLGCTTTIDGKTGIVVPPTNSAISDTLRLSRVIAPESDKVERVIYYLDDTPAYSTKTYQPFDLRYVTHDQQKAVAVIEYASGQRIYIHEAIPSGYTDTFWNFIFRTYQHNTRLYTVILSTLAVGIGITLALKIVRMFRRRREWRATHVRPVPPRRVVTAESLKRAGMIATGRVWSIRIGIVCLSLLVLWGAIVASNRYIATVIRVDGVSMEDTYANEAALFVNKIPVTLAQIEGYGYVPKRGQVVILRAVYGAADQYTRVKDGQETLVKRVLGLPGEHVVVNKGVVTVYKVDGTVIHPDEGSNWSRTMHKTVDASYIDITLGSDEVFVSGDNRPLSVDSRVNGAISTSEILGIVAE